MTTLAAPATAPSGAPPAPTDVSRPRDLVEVVRVLVLLQGAVLVASTLESLFFLAIFGPLTGPTVVLTAVAAALTLAVAWGIGRRSRRARRIALVAEAAIVAGALLDLALSIVMAGQVLPLVAIVTRLLLPIAVIAILRDGAVRAAFRSQDVTPEVTR